MMNETTLTVVGEAVPVESMDVDPSGMRQQVLDARRRTEESYWEFSVLLHEVYQDSMYVAWGYQSWVEYVESELDIQKRKAQYLVAIQEWFGKMKPGVQKWVRELGWTKAKELVGVVTNDNATEWKAKLAGKSYKEVMDVLRGPSDDPGSLADDSDDSNDADTERSVKKSFTLFPDQSSNVELALTKAKQIAQSDKDGHALDMICVDFLSTNAGIDSIQDLFSKIEKQTGVRLVAYDQNEDAIVYGTDLLDAIAGPTED